MSDTSHDYKKFENLIKFISVFLVLAVALLFNVKFTINWPFDVYMIPYVNALLNGATAVLLIMALVFIKMKNVKCIRCRSIYRWLFRFFFSGIYSLPCFNRAYFFRWNWFN